MLSKQQQREILGKKVEASRMLHQRNVINKGISGIIGKSVGGRLAVVPKLLNKKISNTKLKGKKKKACR